MTDTRSRHVPDMPCIEWKHIVHPDGYARVREYRRGPRRMAHRVIWEEVFGPIPDGMLVLHRCDNPPCINPAHLFLGTHTDNMRDRAAKGRDPNSRKTACPKGHPYDAVWAGRRCCRRCHAEDSRRRRARGATDAR
jgi:hypothetical protein